ncbi:MULTISPECIES: dCTP deaminase domain-containing protein [unclassified Sphingomonas]|uniref:dCTP deaminase n=1 Tax=unclassified Sphingomonas TaxID=196159 RepID=UPI002151DAEF|nr:MULTISPECIES: deoxycytidine triphosphate deaminase [unclassified Sphingomonas]MCR5870354.1 deoxycytidine triphosphate deaminase [Sphingomonas sp. J344]UUY01311.1 deoxycytidine triphosphate deaminase [Sphingomonas sp. J315]
MLKLFRGEKGDPGPRGGFWSAQRIRAQHEKATPLFWVPKEEDDSDPGQYTLDDAQLKAASYNIKMGREAYVTPVSDTDPKSIRKLESKESFRIPPGQFAFLLTEEAVRVPPDAFALVALRARELQFKGLINVSGFHIDPGYDGRLVLAVYNAGPSEVHLKAGQALFEVFFADLDETTERPYGGEQSKSKKPLFHIEPEAISAIAGEFETLKGLKNKIEEVESELDDRIRSLEREQTVTRWASALILGGLIAFGVRECSPKVVSAAEFTAGVGIDD